MKVRETRSQTPTAEESVSEANEAVGYDHSVVSQQLENHLSEDSSSKHRLRLRGTSIKLWRNISRKRSKSHRSLKMTSGNGEELLINDSDIVLQDSIQLANSFQSQQRYLLLLNKVLVIAKHKPTGNFHAKDEVPLSEVWLSDNVDQISEVVCDRDRSFVIGWPVVNFVVSFASSEIKRIWFEKLQEQIQFWKLQEWPRNIVIKIINAGQEFSVTKSVLISNTEDANSVLSRCAQETHFLSAAANDFQFCVQTDKDNHPHALLGHECPYAIQMKYAREKQVSSGDNTDSTDINFFDGPKFQVVLKQAKPKLSLKLSLDEMQKSQKKSSKTARSFKKTGHSVEVGNVFGRNLNELFDGSTFCSPVMKILLHLFVHGPYAVDIFRKSAIVSKCLEAKQRLDQGVELDFNSIHVSVSAALLKEFLRCLPNCLLSSDLYSKWIKTSGFIKNKAVAINRIKSLVEILPMSHQQFLRHLVCILRKISDQRDRNGMTSYSLSVCISPSLLWPRSSSGAALSQVNDAKKLNAVVEQMIDSACEIFGDDCLQLFDHLIPHFDCANGGNFSLDAVKEEPLTPNLNDDSSPSSISHDSLLPSPIAESYDSGLATSNSLSCNDLTTMTSIVGRVDTSQNFMTSNSMNDLDVRCSVGSVSHLFRASFEDMVLSSNAEESCDNSRVVSACQLSQNIDKESSSIGLIHEENQLVSEDVNHSGRVISGTSGKSSFEVDSSEPDLETTNDSFNADAVKSDSRDFNSETLFDTSILRNKRSGKISASSRDFGGFYNTDMQNVTQKLDTVEIQKFPKNEATLSINERASMEHNSHGSKKNMSLPDPLRCTLSGSRVKSCSANSSSNLRRLRRGMTDCGSDLFPKQFVQRFSRTFGEVTMRDSCRGLKNSSFRNSDLIRSERSSSQKSLAKDGLRSERRVTLCDIPSILPSNLGDLRDMKPGKLPSYEEAMAEKQRRGGSFGSDPASLLPSLPQPECQKPETGLPSQSENMEKHQSDDLKCLVMADNSGVIGSDMPKSSASCVTTSSESSGVGVACTGLDPFYSGTDVSQSPMLQSTFSKTPPVYGSIHVIPDRCGNSEVNNNVTAFILPDSEPKLNNTEMFAGSERLSSHVVDTSCKSEENPHHPTDSRTQPATTSDPAACFSAVSLDLTRQVELKYQQVAAWIYKRRFDKRVQRKRHRKHSSDPKLHGHHSVYLGRSKSDSCQILEKQCEECAILEDKENFWVSDLVFRKKLAAAKQLRNLRDVDQPQSNKERLSELFQILEETVSRSNDLGSEFSLQDLKKKTSFALEHREKRNDSSLFRHESDGRLNRKCVGVHKNQNDSKPLNSIQNSESLLKICSNITSENYLNSNGRRQNQSQKLLSASASSAVNRFSHVSNDSKIPTSDAKAMNLRVSEQPKRSNSCTDMAVNLSGMVPLHDSPYFI